jgi:hypothetical protein
MSRGQVYYMNYAHLIENLNHPLKGNIVGLVKLQNPQWFSNEWYVSYYSLRPKM